MTVLSVFWLYRHGYGVLVTGHHRRRLNPAHGPLAPFLPYLKEVRR